MAPEALKQRRQFIVRKPDASGGPRPARPTTEKATSRSHFAYNNHFIAQNTSHTECNFSNAHTHRDK